MGTHEVPEKGLVALPSGIREVPTGGVAVSLQSGTEGDGALPTKAG
jgi:hypothetical protein